MQKNEIRPIPITQHKNQLQWTKDLHVKPETLELREESIGSVLCAGMDFLNRITLAQELMPKIDKKWFHKTIKAAVQKR